MRIIYLIALFLFAAIVNVNFYYAGKIAGIKALYALTVQTDYIILDGVYAGEVGSGRCIVEPKLEDLSNLERI